MSANGLGSFAIVVVLGGELGVGMRSAPFASFSAEWGVIAKSRRCMVLRSS